jgi:hypothetical protein
MAMRLVFTVISLGALACGGGSDSTTAPVLPTYPNMAGVWSATGVFPATGINNAAVSENRELRFNVVRTPPLDPWRFVGVVNGTSVTGNCDTSACTFTMAKQ